MYLDYLAVYNKLIGTSKRAETKPLESFALARRDIEKACLKRILDSGATPVQSIDSDLKTGFGESHTLGKKRHIARVVVERQDLRMLGAN
jgi:hypothetical protein